MNQARGCVNPDRSYCSRGSTIGGGAVACGGSCIGGGAPPPRGGPDLSRSSRPYPLGGTDPRPPSRGGGISRYRGGGGGERGRGRLLLPPPSPPGRGGDANRSTEFRPLGESGAGRLGSASTGSVGAGIGRVGGGGGSGIGAGADTCRVRPKPKSRRAISSIPL